MRVFHFNKDLPWVQIISDFSKLHTCPTKEIDGELNFRFKNKWHKVKDYMDDTTIIGKSLHRKGQATIDFAVSSI